MNSFIENSIAYLQEIKANWILTVDEMEETYPNLSRVDIINSFREYARYDKYVYYINGRKGYPSRLQKGFVQFAKTLIDLQTEDNLQISKGKTIEIVRKEDNGDYLVRWVDIFTWASPDELQLFNKFGSD